MSKNMRGFSSFSSHKSFREHQSLSWASRVLLMEQKHSHAGIWDTREENWGKYTKKTRILGNEALVRSKASATIGIWAILSSKYLGETVLTRGDPHLRCLPDYVFASLVCWFWLIYGWISIKENKLNYNSFDKMVFFYGGMDRMDRMSLYKYLIKNKYN